MEKTQCPKLQWGNRLKKAKIAHLEKCAKVCTKDLRAFSVFETPAFNELVQAILDIGATQGQCNVKDLLPSGITLFCFTQKKYESLRAELLPEVKKAIASTDMMTTGRLVTSVSRCVI